MAFKQNQKAETQHLDKEHRSLITRKEDGPQPGMLSSYIKEVSSNVLLVANIKPQ